MEENLGPMEPWQIRAFPKALRERLIDDAHSQRVTVGDLLTRIVLRHYEEPSNGSNNTFGTSITSNNMVDAVQLAPLLPHMPAWLRFGLARRLAAQLGIEPPAPRKRLPAPEKKAAPDAP